jgi:hypothetical protein
VTGLGSECFNVSTTLKEFMSKFIKFLQKTEEGILPSSFDKVSITLDTKVKDITRQKQKQNYWIIFLMRKDGKFPPQC